jgi:hypothetical protein
MLYAPSGSNRSKPNHQGNMLTVQENIWIQEGEVKGEWREVSPDIVRMERSR